MRLAGGAHPGSTVLSVPQRIWAGVGFAMPARGSLPRGAATRSVCRHDVVASSGIVKKAAAASASGLIVQRLAILRGDRRVGTGGWNYATWFPNRGDRWACVEGGNGFVSHVPVGQQTCHVRAGTARVRSCCVASLRGHSAGT
jgi:hypothetical protein